jgi:hypothetical protein
LHIVDCNEWNQKLYLRHVSRVTTFCVKKTTFSCSAPKNFKHYIDNDDWKSSHKINDLCSFLCFVHDVYFVLVSLIEAWIYASICSSKIEISIMHCFNIIFLIFLQKIGTLTLPNVVRISNVQNKVNNF